MTFDSLVSDLRGWQTAWAPRLPEVDGILASETVSGSSDDLSAAVEFRDAMAGWISCGPMLDWSGCHLKSQWAMCNGIHDAIIQQVSYRAGQVSRFVTFADDYRYYSTVLAGKGHAEISWSDLSTVSSGDYVLLSWPNHHGMLDDGLARLTKQCRSVGARIFLDCAFYGTVGNGIVDTSDPIFDAVAFSVSKAYQVSGLRAGIVWGNDLAPSLTVPMRPEYSMYNQTSARTATRIIRELPADHLPRICYPMQEEWCAENGFEPSDVCLFGISRDPAHAAGMRRGGHYARVCLGDFYQRRIDLVK